MGSASSKSKSNKLEAPDLTDAKIGEKIFLGPAYCSNTHSSSGGNIPFVVISKGAKGKEIGKICEYCKNRQDVPGGLGKADLMMGGRKQGPLAAKVAVALVSS